MTADVAVIICAYTEERWADLLAAVESVRRQTLSAGEIVVVIDHNDALLASMREWTRGMPGVVVLANAEARGLSGARNSGIAAAQAELVAFLDDDAVAEPGWLGALTATLGDPAVLGVGGTVEPLWETARPRWFPVEFDWVVGCSYRGLPTRTASIRNMIGASMLVRREVFSEVGGFRNGIGRVGTLPVGCEETELCIRARQRWPGRGFVYEPRARIRHRVPTARARWDYFRARCLAEGRSKALVAGLVGAGDGLTTERVYTLRTLPIGVLCGLAEAVLRRDLAGLLRVGAIVAGFIWTTAGYVSEQFSRFRSRHDGAIVHDTVMPPNTPAT